MIVDVCIIFALLVNYGAKIRYFSEISKDFRFFISLSSLSLCQLSLTILDYAFRLTIYNNINIIIYSVGK